LSGVVTIYLDKSKKYHASEIKQKYDIEYLISDKVEDESDFVLHIDDFTQQEEKKDEIVAHTYEKSEVFTIIGTSSSDKLVEIKVSYFEDMVNTMMSFFPLDNEDRFLMFLPFHVYWGRINIYCGILNGFNTIISPTQFVFYAMKNSKPTLITGIPAFYETIEKNFKNKIKETFKGRFFLGLYMFLKRINLGALFFKNKFKPFTSLFGDNIKYLFTGSAPINPNTITFYNTMGVPLYEGYGMTEVGGSMVSLNTPEHNRSGSVGKIFPGKNVTINSDGEIVITAEDVPSKYYYAENAPNIFADGVIKTGDIGYFDADGYLYLKGRKDNIITLKNGMKVYPDQIESYLKVLHYINACVVFSEDNVNLTLIAVVDNKSITEDKLQDDLDKLKRNTTLNLKPIKRIIMTRTKFSVENKMLTSNFKINRANVIEHYLKN
jgi:long-chain acyl-CoA synthetase